MVDVLPPEPQIPVSSERSMQASSLAFAWMLAAVLGAGAITVLSSQAGLRLIAPLVIMLGYLYYGFNAPGRNTAKLADSIYFLGFLWTLYALINEFVVQHAKASDAESVYRVFGYALVTTASGMFLRLALLQFHQTASDQMEEARDELDVRLEKLARELTNAEHQLIRWRETSVVMMRKFDEELRIAQESVQARIEGVHQNAALTLAGIVQEAVLPFVEELKNITPLTRKMRLAVTTLERATTEAGEGIAKSSSTFIGKLTEGVDAIDKTLPGSLNRAGAALETAATTYAATIVRQGEATTVAFGATADATKKLLELLSGLAKSTGELTRDLSTAKQHFEGLPKVVADAATGAVEEGKTSGAGKLETVVNETVTAVSRAKDAADAVSRTVDEVLSFARKRMGADAEKAR